MSDDPLYSLGLGMAYYAIRFSDIPPEYILAGRCILCRRVGPIDRVRVEKRWGADYCMRFVDQHLRCMGCGNIVANTFTVAGRYLR